MTLYKLILLDNAGIIIINPHLAFLTGWFSSGLGDSVTPREIYKG